MHGGCRKPAPQHRIGPAMAERDFVWRMRIP